MFQFQVDDHIFFLSQSTIDCVDDFAKVGNITYTVVSVLIKVSKDMSLFHSSGHRALNVAWFLNSLNQRVNLSLACFSHTPMSVERQCCSAGVGQPRLLKRSPAFARKLLPGWGGDLSFQCMKFALNVCFRYSKLPVVLGEQVSNMSYKVLLWSTCVSSFVFSFPQSWKKGAGTFEDGEIQRETWCDWCKRGT